MRSCGVVLALIFFAAARRIDVETIVAASPHPARAWRERPLPLQGRVSEARSRCNCKWWSGYTAAVVTPPSMTMVWPVMKLEASEAR